MLGVGGAAPQGGRAWSQDAGVLHKSPVPSRDTASLLALLPCKHPAGPRRGPLMARHPGASCTQTRFLPALAPRRTEMQTHPAHHLPRCVTARHPGTGSAKRRLRHPGNRSTQTRRHRLCGSSARSPGLQPSDPAAPPARNIGASTARRRQPGAGAAWEGEAWRWWPGSSRERWSSKRRSSEKRGGGHALPPFPVPPLRQAAQVGPAHQMLVR